MEYYYQSKHKGKKIDEVIEKIPGEIESLKEIKADKTETVILDADGKVPDEKLHNPIKNLTDGTAPNSLQTPNSQAISEGAVALGKDSIAGSKCFIITAFDDTNKSYTLDSVEGLAVGDVYSLKLSQNFDDFGSIIEINGNTVTVDNYHTDQNNSDRHFRVVKKPDCGTTDFGLNALSAGENCIAAGENSFSTGKNNVSGGKYAVTVGKGNEAGYSGFSGGTNNISNADSCFLWGKSNIATIEAAAAILMGRGLLCSCKDQIIFGRYNIKDEEGKYRLIIGNGGSDSTRSNSFTLDKNGNVRSTGDIESAKYGKLSEKIGKSEFEYMGNRLDARIDETANAVKDTISKKESVIIDSISPISHTVGVNVNMSNILEYPYPDTTKILGGVTYTDNGDGTVTANGTSTANMGFVLKRGTKFESGLFVLSGCPSGGSGATYNIHLSLYKDGKVIKAFHDFGKGTNEFNCADYDYDNYTIYILVKDGTTVNNLTFYPKLCVSPTTTTLTVKDENDEVQATYTPNADGSVSGVKSVYPVMKLELSDTTADMTVEYNKDINTALSDKADVADISNITDSVDKLNSKKADKSNSYFGFEGGGGAFAKAGGAIGEAAIAGDGFAGGKQAKTMNDTATPIDAIQLGKGWNKQAKTLQVYDYQLMDADGNIPAERLAKMAGNIKDGVSIGSINQLFDGGDTFDFTGKNANATALDSTLTGDVTKGASGNYAVSLGGKSAALGKRSVAEGTTTIAKGAYSHAEGDNSVTLGSDSHAEGYMTTAKGDGSHSEGADTVAEGDYSHAEGSKTKAKGLATHAEGWKTEAIGNDSHSEGFQSIAEGSISHSEGNQTVAKGHYSHTEGFNSITGGVASKITAANSTNKTYTVKNATGFVSNHKFSIAFHNRDEIYVNVGKITNVSDNIITVDTFKDVDIITTAPYIILGNADSSGSGGTSSPVEEADTHLANSSHAEGENTIAIGHYSHTEGKDTIAYGESSHAEGNATQATGKSSHAEGFLAQSNGRFSHAEGNETIASKDCSHAEGNTTQANGKNSHSEGNQTLANGENAHAEGELTGAYGKSSHSEGKQCSAAGAYSHAQNLGTLAYSDCQTVQGKYNKADDKEKYAVIVGNGEYNGNRSNAHTLDWDGNAWFAGDIEDGSGNKLSEKANKTKAFKDVINVTINNSASWNWDDISELKTIYTTGSYLVNITAIGDNADCHDTALLIVKIETTNSEQDSGKYSQILITSDGEILYRESYWTMAGPQDWTKFESPMANKQDKVNIDTTTDLYNDLATLKVNTLYKPTKGINGVDVVLPSAKVGDFIQVDFYTISDMPVLSVEAPSGIMDLDLKPEKNKVYSLYFDWGVIGVDSNNNINEGWRFSYTEYDPLTISE